MQSGIDSRCPATCLRRPVHVIVPNWGLSELTGFDGELRSFGTSESPFGSLCRQTGAPRSTRQPGKSTGDRCPLGRAGAVRLRRQRAGLLQRRAPPAPPRLRPCAAPVESRLTSSLPAEHCRRQLRQRQRCRPAWSPCRIRTQRLRTMHLRRRRACPRLLAPTVVDVGTASGGVSVYRPRGCSCGGTALHRGSSCVGGLCGWQGGADPLLIYNCLSTRGAV